MWLIFETINFDVINFSAMTYFRDDPFSEVTQFSKNFYLFKNLFKITDPFKWPVYFEVIVTLTRKWKLFWLIANFWITIKGRQFCFW